MRKEQSMKQAKMWTMSSLDLSDNNGAILFLKVVNRETLIPIFIDQAEIQPIIRAVHKRIRPDNPLVHGVLMSLMKEAGFSLFRVEIYDILQDAILLARLLFEGQSYSAEKPLISPVTPSDAFILATLAECPIYVAEKVIKRVGAPVGIELEQFGI